MTTLALIDQIGGWWNDLTHAKQLFYGIGILATLISIIMALLSVAGMDHHDGFDGGALDHDGGVGVFSVKPLTGFFLAFGWVGGIALDNGFSLFAATAFALFAGAGVMAIIVAMFRTMMALKSDGTMQVKAALGAVGTVYVTVPANKGSGGQVVVNFSGRQETLAALSAAPAPIASGEKIKVVSIVDGRTVLIEPL
jgi:membrane protein implicated in regulation of membrane protease activity